MLLPCSPCSPLHVCPVVEIRGASSENMTILKSKQHRTAIRAPFPFAWRSCFHFSNLLPLIWRLCPYNARVNFQNLSNINQRVRPGLGWPSRLRWTVCLYRPVISRTNCTYRLFTDSRVLLAVPNFSEQRKQWRQPWTSDADLFSGCWASLCRSSCSSLFSGTTNHKN